MVEEKRGKEVPETLMKYYECNEYSYDAIKNNYLWASHPSQFNDPFDCNYKHWAQESFTEENMLSLAYPFLKDKESKIFNDPYSFLDLLLGRIGITCLNSNNGDTEDLFWGYYANRHGFAIEFDSFILSQRFHHPPLEVTYSNFEKVKRIALTSDPYIFQENVIKWIIQKKKIWEKENEFRYIFSDCDYFPDLKLGDINSRKKEYPTKAIKRILLGDKFFENIFPLENSNNNAFIYDHSKSKNQYNYQLLKLLIDKLQYPVYWMFPGNNFKLELLPIKLSYFDPLGIIIKMEKPK